MKALAVTGSSPVILNDAKFDEYTLEDFITDFLGKNKISCRQVEIKQIAGETYNIKIGDDYNFSYHNTVLDSGQFLRPVDATRPHDYLGINPNKYYSAFTIGFQAKGTINGESVLLQARRTVYQHHIFLFVGNKLKTQKSGEPEIVGVRIDDHDGFWFITKPKKFLKFE